MNGLLSLALIGSAKPEPFGGRGGGLRLGVVSQSQRKEEAEVTDSIRVTVMASFPER